MNNTSPRYYTADQIAIAAVIGGPLAGCWLMARNYQLFGEGNNARKTIISGIVFLSVLSALMDLAGMPTGVHQNSTSTFAIIIGPLAFKSLADFFQQRKLNEVITAGVKKQSYWRMTGIGLVSILLTFVIFIGMAIIFDVLHLPQGIIWPPVGVTQ